ncbi:putative Rab-GTPase-TBC domain, calponin domain, Zinc finger, HIT-type, CH domain superfamily [Plasmopara halstedii]
MSMLSSYLVLGIVDELGERKADRVSLTHSTAGETRTSRVVPRSVAVHAQVPFLGVVSAARETSTSCRMELVEDEPATGKTLYDVNNDGEIVRRWIEMVLGDKLQGNLPTALYSGELLCDLVNKVYKALGMKSQINPMRSSGNDDSVRNNLREYLRACEVLGVARQYLFEPNDLIQLKDIDKVYSNILALQSVAISLSNRRSIDERSSTIIIPDWPLLSENGEFADEEIMETDDLDLISPQAVQMLQQSRWERLLSEYEYQQQRHEEQDRADDSLASEGLGPLAHGIWRTEERIRALIMRDDQDFGAVPEGLHGKLWMLASGALVEMRKQKGQYERLVSLELENTEAIRQIDVDVNRTIPEEDKELWTDEKLKMMRRILVAYSFHNPGLGYCQGLNYIVARSLQYLSEEESFYLLIAIIRLVPDDYYTTMLGLAVDQHVFADLVRLQCPDITEHLAELGGSGMELSLACTEWFLTLFASPCAKEVTFKIWDAIFLQGDEILFKVALALLQQEKTELLACKTYGDMLKRLNDLGRGEIDALALMRVSKNQECVVRGRIEDFRAHHRLQLASDIVASTVNTDDSRSSTTGRRSSETRSEPRMRIFGRKKQGIFRHMDKIPPRLARTFGRTLTEEYIEAIRHEHPNFAQYYDGGPPQVKEEYWGSASCSPRRRASGGRRECIDGFAVSSIKENEADHAIGEPRLISRRATSNTFEDRGVEQTRDRRSKSSGVMHDGKIHNKSAMAALSSRQENVREEDFHLIGKTPMAWIQRLEEWHKDLKSQKEKKKAEKRLRRNQRLDHVIPGSKSGQLDVNTTWLSDAIDASTRPANQTQDNEGFTNSYRRRSNDFQRSSTENIALLEEPSLSRSYSDPFRSPPSVEGARLVKQSSDTIYRDADQVSTLPHESLKGDIDEIARTLNLEEVRKVSQSRSGRASRGLSDQSTLSRSTNSYVNTASFNLDLQEETSNETSLNRSLDEKDAKEELQGVSPTLAQLTKPLAHECLYSPVNCQLSSMDLLTEGAGTCSLPQMQRIESHLDDDSLALYKHPHKPRLDCSQTMRERAQVLQYMHRKASDASSIAGSIPRSPARLSESSSDSSRFADYTKSMPFRKSSFSFFDKLSSDLENSAHGLDSLVDESEFKTDSIGRESMSSVATGRSSTVDEQRPMGEAIFISNMGKAYDGKKRWNETILATTARDSATGGRHAATKKRLSGRTHKLSVAMRHVDDETRNEVRSARLDALEADNFGEDIEDGVGTQDGDETYIDEEERDVKFISGGRETSRKSRRTVIPGKKKWKVKSLAQLVFEELGNGENAEKPNYLTVAAGPSTFPARKFCCVCGFFANYSCRRCGSKYCSVGCENHHKESGCMKFGL